MSFGYTEFGTQLEQRSSRCLSVCSVGCFRRLDRMRHRLKLGRLERRRKSSEGRDSDVRLSETETKEGKNVAAKKCRVTLWDLALIILHRGSMFDKFIQR